MALRQLALFRTIPPVLSQPPATGSVLPKLVGWAVPPAIGRTNWLCLARSALWRNRPARDVPCPQALHPSQVWLCFAQSAICLPAPAACPLKIGFVSQNRLSASWRGRLGLVSPPIGFVLYTRPCLDWRTSRRSAGSGDPHTQVIWLCLGFRVSCFVFHSPWLAIQPLPHPNRCVRILHGLPFRVKRNPSETGGDALSLISRESVLPSIGKSDSVWQRHRDAEGCWLW